MRTAGRFFERRQIARRVFTELVKFASSFAYVSPQSSQVLRSGEAYDSEPEIDVMLTFVWNPYGFQIVDAYYVRNIVAEIAALRGERSERKLMAHAGNARPHTAKVRWAFCDENFLRIASHSHAPYSPHLAPSDFFLFRHLKNCLKGQ
jgi:hypothetical protein